MDTGKDKIEVIMELSDKEIINGLIAHDNKITETFFFRKCRPLFISIINHVFSYEVDYDEFVNELYVYLMGDDASKLKSFQYRSSLYQWLKILAIRYFVKKRNRMIDVKRSETPCNEHVKSEGRMDFSKIDMKILFESMPNKRYAYVIQKMIIEDVEPELLACEMNITTANLYNIKRRAMAQLTRITLKDVKEYGRE